MEFDFVGMDAEAALNASSTEKSRFGYITHLKIGEKEIAKKSGMKIYPPNEQKKEKDVLATLSAFQWEGHQDGPITFTGLCCSTVHSELLGIMSAATKTTVEIEFAAYEYHPGHDYFVARESKGKCKANITMDDRSGKLHVGVGDRPFDANNDYYQFSITLSPQSGHKNEIDVVLKEGHATVKPWGHAAG
jgi:hypothetical protein